jgi:hypothetical protein
MPAPSFCNKLVLKKFSGWFFLVCPSGRLGMGFGGKPD